MARPIIARVMSTLAIVVGLLGGGPTGAAAQGPVFKSGVDMVPLTVTVTDPTGKYIPGLTAEDFAVFEDGVQQSVSFFAREPLPVDVAFVLDVSASMHADMPLVRDAAKGLVRALRDGDRGAVVAVTSSVAMPQRFTDDRDRVAGAIDRLAPAGTTAIYDGLYIALKEFVRERQARTEPRRQVLVLLSDGLDNSSHVSADDVSDLARRVGVSIYVVALEGSNRTAASSAPRNLGAERAAFTMRALAQDAGGRIFLPTMATELPAIYGTIAAELASQYDIAYVPSRPGGDGAFRRVTVRIVAPTRAAARTRSGYHAVRATGQSTTTVSQQPHD